ncbi:hypothetical protein TNCV_2013291 [Trichonephila clavipes]|nr:hypothetical protein TNCV_2013291 [Trichonephila clavipes]
MLPLKPKKFQLAKENGNRAAAKMFKVVQTSIRRVCKNKRFSNVVVVANATYLTYSDRGPRNSSWQGTRSTPVVGLGLKHHTNDSTN